MQVYNTLSTVLLHMKERKKSRFYLKKALSCTAESREYHIYTLANLALLFKVYGIEEKSKFYFRKACAIAAEGENHLALNQIKADFSREYS
jgi:hypothetical protein